MTIQNKEQYKLTAWLRLHHMPTRKNWFNMPTPEKLKYPVNLDVVAHYSRDLDMVLETKDMMKEKPIVVSISLNIFMDSFKCFLVFIDRKTSK